MSSFLRVYRAPSGQISGALIEDDVEIAGVAGCGSVDEVVDGIRDAGFEIHTIVDEATPLDYEGHQFSMEIHTGPTGRIVGVEFLPPGYEGPRGLEQLWCQLDNWNELRALHVVFDRWGWQLSDNGFGTFAFRFAPTYMDRLGFIFQYQLWPEFRAGEKLPERCYRLPNLLPELASPAYSVEQKMVALDHEMQLPFRLGDEFASALRQAFNLALDKGLISFGFQSA